MSRYNLIGRITAFGILLLFLLSGALSVGISGVTAGAEFHDIRPVIILDAGHGGEDSGTVGINGIYEKTLNLEMTNLLGDLLTAAGYEVILTRTEDRLLYTAEQNIRGKRKQYDLYNRALTANSHPGALFISIHMNSFPDERYRGFQVWCSDDAGSALLAEKMRASVSDQLQPENNRKVKQAGSEMYLLHHIDGIAVLAECGFLSNAEECENLCREDYRRQLSFSLFCAIINYLTENQSDGDL